MAGERGESFWFLVYGLWFMVLTDQCLLSEMCSIYCPLTIDHCLLTIAY